MPDPRGAWQTLKPVLQRAAGTTPTQVGEPTGQSREEAMIDRICASKVLDRGDLFD
jgi:hypothetical protein